MKVLIATGLLAGFSLMPLLVTANPDLKPFYASSMNQIVAARSGKPFILCLWSLSCVHCREDLKLFSSLTQKYPELDLVLIATDTLDDAAEIHATLVQNQLTKIDNWLFADEYTEQLRYHIDSRWYGELPRTYLYNATHQKQAISGQLNAAEIERWINRHYRH